MLELKSKNVVGEFPATVAQKRVWIMEQIHPGHRGLNLAIQWEVRGALSSDVVEAAFQKIVDRHEILRTRFVERDGEPVQQVVSHVDFKLGRVDIRTVPEPDQEERIRVIARELAAEPFDMASPCLLRVNMVQVSRDRAALLISVHNSVFDGYSIRVLGSEFGTIAAALVEGKAPVLPELSLQYGDFALWQQEYETSGALSVEQDYWLKTLSGLSYFEVPSDHPRIAAEPAPRTYAARLPDQFDLKLEGAARLQDVSSFTLGCSAVAIALQRFTGRSDVSFAVQVAGRSEVDLESLIGIFTNPVVLRFDAAEPLRSIDFAKQSRGVVEGALANQNLAFDQLVKAINPPRDPLRIPLVSIMFNLQRAFLEERRYGNFELVSVPSHSPGTLYDLNINILGRNSGWRLVIDYNENLFDQSTVAALADLIIASLEIAVSNPDRRIAEFPRPERRADLAEPKAEAGNTVLRPQPRTDRDSIKQQLAMIWSEVLGMPLERVDGNFFDLGGYSILALRMLAKVGDAFGTRPSLHAFLGDPTLSGLAAGIVSAAPPVSILPVIEKPRRKIWEMVELKKAPATAPVFLSINQTFFYRSLLGAFHQDCVVANLTIYDQQALEDFEERGFEAALDEAVQNIQSHYGGRPLFLCGLCVDGRIALRLAQKLVTAGEDVPLLGMIDSWAPGAHLKFSRLTRLRDRWNNRIRRFAHYFGRKIRGQIGWAELFKKNSFTARWSRLFGMNDDQLDLETLIDDTVTKLVEHSKAYRFDPYSGETALFLTLAHDLVPKDGILGWSGILAADTGLFKIDSWHGDVSQRAAFKKMIDVFAAKMARARPVVDDGS